MQFGQFPPRPLREHFHRRLRERLLAGAPASLPAQHALRDLSQGADAAPRPTLSLARAPTLSGATLRLTPGRKLHAAFDKKEAGKSKKATQRDGEEPHALPAVSAIAAVSAVKGRGNEEDGREHLRRRARAIAAVRGAAVWAGQQAAPRLGAGPSLTDAEYAALVRERHRPAAPGKALPAFGPAFSRPPLYSPAFIRDHNLQAPGAAAVGKALTPPKFGLRPPGVLLTVVEDADLSAGADAKRESSALA
ncbi:MAG: hypothetical protein MO847_07220 [Candidatus Protistobacter heckmanni]|nr:hypothetical protein [Candidatus Protistobacter heckmanni]